MGELSSAWLWRLSVAGGVVALAILAMNPLVVRISEAPSAEAPAAPAQLAAAPQCEITGLAEYGIEETQSGACSASVYVRACREAQHLHRERCQEFCGALKEIGGRRLCEGSSSPVAQLFDPDRHCRELRHEHFQVSCRVSSVCSCVASTAGEAV